MRGFSWLGALIGLVIGGLLGFFVVFNLIFSDSFTLADQLSGLALTLVCYGIAGALFGLALPASGWRWALWLTLPALVLVLWYSAREGGWLLHLAYLLVALSAAAAAAALSARLRARRGLSD